MIKEILINVIYLLALINPVSKISILSVFFSKEDVNETVLVAMKSSLIALGILLLVMILEHYPDSPFKKKRHVKRTIMIPP